MRKLMTNPMPKEGSDISNQKLCFPRKKLLVPLTMCEPINYKINSKVR